MTTPFYFPYHKKGAILLLFTALSFLVYWRSLTYTFHYDDYAKIVFNQGTKRIDHAFLSIINRSYQSSDRTLSQQMYRPFFTLGSAVLNFISGGKPTGHRLLNIFLHGVNATLVTLLAMGLFGLSLTTGIVCGLAFHLHPTQVESVIWASELSNTMASFCVLASLWIWEKSRQSVSTNRIWFIPVLYVMGLGFRETPIMLPFILTSLTLVFPLPQKIHRPFLKMLSTLYFLTMAYLFMRNMVIGRMSHLSPDEFSWFTYLWSILISFGMSLRFLLIPFPSSINHRPWTLPPENLFLLAATLAILISIIFLSTWGALRRKNKWCLNFLILVLFWLPTSQLIPIRSIFSERFLYLLIVPFSWSMGMLYQKYEEGIRWLMASYLVGITLLTFKTIPSWENDQTLWEQAIKSYPTYWNNWVFLAEWQKTNALLKNQRTSQENEDWRNQAEKNYIQALRCGLPSTNAARIFLRLTEINFQQGKLKEAKVHAQRALAINPNLATEYEMLRRKYVH
ncbi:MAG: hypothetical protein KCHDKBKB_00317 [Elusimicrobia bacterium]|nr:hypothetical protein [Elusimicrobiota bacterium]